MSRTIEGVKADDTVLNENGREVGTAISVYTITIVEFADGSSMTLKEMKRRGFSIKALEGIEEVKE